MVTVNSDPEAGGNVIQPDDGRDERGRLPEPLDAAHYGVENPDVEVIAIPGMPLSQPAGTGPVVSTPQDDDDLPDGTEHRDDSAAAQGGPGADHDISGTPIVEGAVAAPSAPATDGGGESRTTGTMSAAPAADRQKDATPDRAPSKAAAPAKKAATPAADKK